PGPDLRELVRRSPAGRQLDRSCRPRRLRRPGLEGLRRSGARADLRLSGKRASRTGGRSRGFGAGLPPAGAGTMTTSPTAPDGRSHDAPILRVEALSKTFGKDQILKRVDFDVKQGEVVFIIGASGSGKSTLLRCINRLEEPSAGRIFLGAEEITARGV